MTQTSFVIKRLISATCQEVFAAWSQPELMQQWFFPMRPGWKAEASNEFIVGGQYKQDMIAQDGTVYSHTGVYKGIIPNQKIVFTWNSNGVKNTLVTVQLRPVDSKTEITLIHELLPHKEHESHHGGWQDCIDNLETFLDKKSYQCEINYQAPIEKVYFTITEQEGLKNWWTKDCTVDSIKIGAELTFRFGKTCTLMKIKDFIPDQKVVWECLQWHMEDPEHPELGEIPEWVGTTLIFQLTKNAAGGTKMHFVHEGLTKELACFNHCQNRWNFFLKESITAYLETGTGKPYC